MANSWRVYQHLKLFEIIEMEDVNAPELDQIVAQTYTREDARRIVDALAARADRAALEAEVERLREALREIEEYAFSVAHDTGNGKAFYAERDARKIQEIAHTALASVEQGGHP